MQAIHPAPSTGMYSQQAIGMPSPPSRKRKRLNHVHYSEVQERDAEGRIREVIVIEDTPPPTASASASIMGGTASVDTYIPPRKTRAQVAAAKAALTMSHTTTNGVGSSSSSVVAPLPKKRKRDNVDELPTTNGLYAKKPNLGLLPAVKHYPGDSATVAVSRTFFIFLFIY